MRRRHLNLKSPSQASLKAWLKLVLKYQRTMGKTYLTTREGQNFKTRASMSSRSASPRVVPSSVTHRRRPRDRTGSSVSWSPFYSLRAQDWLCNTSKNPRKLDFAMRVRPRIRFSTTSVSGEPQLRAATGRTVPPCTTPIQLIHPLRLLHSQQGRPSPMRTSPLLSQRKHVLHCPSSLLRSPTNVRPAPDTQLVPRTRSPARMATS